MNWGEHIVVDPTICHGKVADLLRQVGHEAMV
jgi:uncharacterized protein (DUF433 family)